MAKQPKKSNLQKPIKKVAAPAEHEEQPVKRAQRTNMHEVVNAYLLMPATLDVNEKLAGLRTLKPSKRVLRQAIESLAAHKHDVSILEAYAIERGFSPYPKPGKTKPSINSMRKYNVQENRKTNGLYARIPVEHLTDSKGSSVWAVFQDGRIVILASAEQAEKVLQSSSGPSS